MSVSPREPEASENGWHLSLGLRKTIRAENKSDGALIDLLFDSPPDREEKSVAFELLRERYDQFLLKTAQSKIAQFQVPNRDDATDVVQDVWTSIWDRVRNDPRPINFVEGNRRAEIEDEKDAKPIPKRPDKGEEKAWLRKITIHKALDFVKRAENRNRRKTLSFTSVDERTQPGTINPDQVPGRAPGTEETVLAEIGVSDFESFLLNYHRYKENIGVREVDAELEVDATNERRWQYYLYRYHGGCGNKEACDNLKISQPDGSKMHKKIGEIYQEWEIHQVKA